MESFIKNHARVIEIFESYICTNNSECTIDFSESAITGHLRLTCRDTVGNTANSYFDMMLSDSVLTITFSKYNGNVLDSDAYDLNKIFSYNLLRELINNYIKSTLKQYEYELYFETTDIVAIKPTRVLDGLFAYIYASSEVSLIFSGTPTTRDINVQVPKCDITISVDAFNEGVTLYYAEVNKVEEGSPEVTYTVERQLNLEDALKAIVDRL